MDLKDRGYEDRWTKGLKASEKEDRYKKLIEKFAGLETKINVNGKRNNGIKDTEFVRRYTKQGLDTFRLIAKLCKHGFLTEQ